jgi:hypothetical protein
VAARTPPLKLMNEEPLIEALAPKANTPPLMLVLPV